jgi:hypothetical protein
LLLSGYNPISDYDFYWSNGDDCENKMVKEAMPRDRIRMINTAIYFGSMGGGGTRRERPRTGTRK